MKTLTKEEMIEQGRRIKKVRQDQNLKQDDFCAALGISRFSLGRIERGDQAIDSPSLFNLNQKYGISSDYILFGKISGTGPDVEAIKKELETTKELLAAKTEIIQLLKRTAGVN